MKKGIHKVNRKLFWSMCFCYIRLTFILFGLTLCHSAFSQNSGALPDQIDSLKALVNRLPENDPQFAKLTSLYSQRCFDSLKIVDGLEAVKILKKSAEESDNDRTLGYYYEAMGFLHPYSNLKSAYQVKADLLLKNHHEFYRWGQIEGSKDEHSISLKVIHAYEQAVNHYEVLKDTFSLRHLHAELAMMYRWWKLPGNTYKDTEEIREYKAHRDEALHLSGTTGEASLKLEMLCQQQADLWFQQINKTSDLELSIANLVLNIDDPFDRAWGYYLLGNVYSYNNRYFLGLNYYASSIELLEQLGETNLQSFCYYAVASTYQRVSIRQPELRGKTIENCEKAILIHQRMKFTKGIEKVYWLYAQAKRGINEDSIVPDMKEIGQSLATSIPDSIDRALDSYFNYLGDNLNSRYNKQLFAFHLEDEAAILKNTGMESQALKNHFRALNLLLSIADYRGASYPGFLIAMHYKERKEYKKALDYALDSYQYATETTWTITMISSSALLAEIYQEMGQLNKAIEYLKINQQLVTESEQLNSQIQFTEMEVAGALKESQHEIDRLEAQRKLVESENENQRIILALAGVVVIVLLMLSVVVYRNSVSRKKANQVLSKQKDSLQKTLSQLQSTQSQLIHSEKMASLGELTAGIAHEIQNPLNFVNNFSDVNKELALELLEELRKGNGQEAEAIIRDIIENEEKILHHGQRADAIVKGMLQHSRAGGGEKELTDINALADEYLRLAYHGLRAKDKNFNSDFKTELDPDLPKINVVPQDIGRVLLNLINNAFYAVSEASAKETAVSNYKPTVTVITKKVGDKIEISVSDNGPGIPDSIKDKIFQPFFTTKATGQGTGLGLSLSYDIVTKGHGGTIVVKSKEKEGSIFIIKLKST